MKLKQKPTVLIGPAGIGLYGLIQAIWGEGTFRVIGLALFVFSAISVTLIAFIITPKPPTKSSLALLAVVLLAMTTLSACQIPADPNIRGVGNLFVHDNPANMNGDNLGILTYWYNYTHQVQPLTTTETGTDSVEVTTTNNLLEATSLDSVMPTNVVMARAAWLNEPTCILGIFFTGGAFIGSAAIPPVGIGATIVAYGPAIGGAGLTAYDCYNTFAHGEMEPDASVRWLDYCKGTYQTSNDWNMLDPGWQPSSVVKFEECVVFGWAAMRAGALDKFIDTEGNAHLSNHICAPDPQFPLLISCYWR